MLITLNEDTKAEIIKLVKEVGYRVIFDSKVKFQGETHTKDKTIILKSEIDTEDFDYLFNQIEDKYDDIPRDQEMFLFNAFHEIGHISLNLWRMNSNDETANRINNLDIDKKINKWAHDQFIIWVKQKTI